MESLRKMKNWKKRQQSNSNKWKIGGNRKKNREKKKEIRGPNRCSNSNNSSPQPPCSKS
jgi:hypothetical protein